MPWLPRRNKRRKYYYSKTRVGKRVVSSYVGAGVEAEAQAREVALRQLAREAAREEDARWQEVEDLLKEMEALTAELVREAMAANGFYLHRGQWRRRRHARVV